MNFLLTISRILVGLLFIVSGLIKANDPLGFSYKLDEYFIVFNMPWLAVISLYLSIFISVFEITLGAAVITGIKIREVSVSLLLMILFFTWLTGYSAVTGKVTDCGCFGDAIKLTPWQSFQKDIVLTILIAFIFFKRKSISSKLSVKAGNMFLACVFVLCTIIAYWCYNHLPIKDFRPYKKGTNLIEAMQGTPDQLKWFYILKNKKSRKQQEFEGWPQNWDQEWDYESSRTEVLKKGNEPKIHDFSISDIDGNDYTEDFLTDTGYIFMVIAYDLYKTNRKVQPRINTFSEKCEAEGIRLIGLTATLPQETDQFRHEIQAMYPYYYADATALKTFIRSNPGLVLMKGGIIIEKWHYKDIPGFEEVKETYFK